MPLRPQDAAGEQGEAPLLLDVGAGHGVAAAAAAARGHAVVVVEPQRGLREALQATARQPQLHSRLRVHEEECVGLGGDVCLCSNGVVVQQVRSLMSRVFGLMTHHRRCASHRCRACCQPIRP